VVPERVSFGKYAARITWTPLGAALAALIDVPASVTGKEVSRGI